MHPTPIGADWLAEQHWETYTPEDHEVWGIFCKRRLADLEANGSRLFLEGAEIIGLRPDRVPDLRDVNARLGPRTGWAAVPVKGFLPEFGHVPLHAHLHFADFLRTFGTLAAAARTEDDVTRAARLFWFTVEFGLIREGGREKVYGSGLISSHADCANALGPRCDRRPFDLDAVLEQPFEIDRFQDVLFVVESFEQLFEAVEAAGRLFRGRRLRTRATEAPGPSCGQSFLAP